MTITNTKTNLAVGTMAQFAGMALMAVTKAEVLMVR